VNVQYIDNKETGKPEYAVVPIKDFERLLEAWEMLEDIRDFDTAMGEIMAGEELVPLEVVDAVLGGENPIKVWRHYRRLTQEDLAKKAGITKGYLSQIERGKRVGTADKLSGIANALNLTIDDLI